jgi:hypothetical protein
VNLAGVLEMVVWWDSDTHLLKTQNNSESFLRGSVPKWMTLWCEIDSFGDDVTVCKKRCCYWFYLWKSCPEYSSFSRSISSSLYATLQLFHIMAVLWHWVSWCCTGNASLVTLLNMSVFQLVWVWLEGFNTCGDTCKSQWPLLSVLSAVPHNSP